MDHAGRRFRSKLSKLMKFLGSVLVCVLVSGCIRTLPQPDPVTWELASIPGPALFTGTLVRVENFENADNENYGCRTARLDKSIDGDKTSQLQKICVSNGCGLERLTIKIEKPLAGNIPDMVTLNHVMGEFCEQTAEDFTEFLISIEKDKTWSGFKIVRSNGLDYVLPNILGCLGDIDIKPYLENSGIKLNPDFFGSDTEWRSSFAYYKFSSPCKPPESTNTTSDKAVSLDQVISLWKSAHVIN